MFKRKKSYPVVVAEARAHAKKTGRTVIVYQIGKTYNSCLSWYYPRILYESKKPIIQLLVCLPNGIVAQ